MTPPPEPRTNLDELERLLTGASEAPWQWLDGGGETSDELQDGHGEAVGFQFRDDVLPAVTDGRLCAALRNAAPQLIASARRAEAAGVPLREALDTADNGNVPLGLRLKVLRDAVRAALTARAAATEDTDA